MVNCIFCPNKKRAFYGFEGESPVTCREHAADDFVYLNKKRCQHPGCTSKALFGTDKAIWCGKHKKADDTNLNIGKCEVEGCSRTKSHGFKKKTVCGLHAISGMDDLSKNMCSHEQCYLSGNFQFGGQRYCKRHKPEEGKRVQKSCFCGKTANYGYDKREYCNDHSLPGMSLIKKRTVMES